MLVDMHRQAALDNEQAATLLGDPAARSFVRRAIIELYWGASFHWIAYGCQRKHGKHKENHTKLVSYLRDQGEDTIATVWNTLDSKRVGGWYGTHVELDNVEDARRLWQDIRTWTQT